MNINNNNKESTYTYDTLEKEPKKNDNLKKESVELQYENIDKSFDISGLNNHASNYNKDEAKTVLEGIDYGKEVQDFSKQTILERFSQPLTQAQAHLSVDSVAKLLQ